MNWKGFHFSCYGLTNKFVAVTAADLEIVLSLTWILSFRPTSFWEYALFSDIFEIVINGVI